jgi:para-nitrobenzyl esterase
MNAFHLVRRRIESHRVALSAISIGLVFGCADTRQGSDVAVLESALDVDGAVESADVSASITTDASVDTSSAAVGTVLSGAQVVTSQGLIQGLLANNGTRIFLGIPYAEPPVGALRFRPSQPARPWGLTRLADTFGPACPQPRGGLSAEGPQSEDCLYLNVYAANRTANAPVLVFIHGGGFVTGAGSQFDGQLLAESGQAIVVTINYRLGALGLLTLPALDAERGGIQSGNDAFRDQQLALTWVKNNIRAFGGDPENVTVFGESAGAVSTCVQMVSPLSRTLAKRFILQSGTCDSAGTTVTLAQAQATSARIANAFCSGRSDVVACLRDVPASDLAAIRIQTSIFDLELLPVVNPADPLLPQAPRDMIAAGNYNRGDVIVGSNARELGLFQLGGTAPIARSIAELNAFIDGRFGPQALLVKQQYTAASDAEANTTLVRLGTDLIFRCPARALARRTSGQGSRAFLYHFEEGAALHAFELPYVFGTPDPRLGAATLVESVKQEFQTAFTSFALLGTPRPVLGSDLSSQALTPWPRYATATDRHISLRSNRAEGTGLSKADCDFLESIGAVQ